MIERTVLEWTYQPTTYFEAPYTNSTSDYTISVADGTVNVTLVAPQDPVKTDLLKAVEVQVETIFASRRMQTHRPCKLEGPSTVQYYPNGHRVIAEIAASPERTQVRKRRMRVDFVLKDVSGKIVQDTKAERKAQHARFLDLAVQKSQDALLQSLLRSYSAAVDDPANELMHLYEIRDVLANHFGSKKAALKRLAIPESQWQRLGDLANVVPLKQGRHPGRHAESLRDATQGELDEARQIVRGWIEKYALSLPS
jgi:hypothetical protein